MRIANQACILVTDGRTSLFFRNEGDADFPDFRALSKRVDDNPPDHEHKAAGPGHTLASSSGGTRRSAFSEPDYHQRAEDAFAAEAADFLHEQALAGAFETLIVVAPPRTLGVLRKHYHDDVRRRILAELAKDLVKHPVPEIERIIGRS